MWARTESGGDEGPSGICKLENHQSNEAAEPVCGSRDMKLRDGTESRDMVLLSCMGDQKKAGASAVPPGS